MIKGFEDYKDAIPKQSTPVTPRSLPWASKIIANVATARTGSPSQLYIWFHIEHDKRSKGLENELDLADIMAAIKGIKNKWSEIIKMNTAIFKDFHNGIYDWNEIFKLKGNDNVGK